MNKTALTRFLWAMLCVLLAVQPVGAQLSNGYLSNDQISGSVLGSSDRAAVVLIHGWNPDGYTNKFTDGDWPQLVNALSTRMSGSGWKLLLFHWECDASTGPVIDTDVGETGFYNAREAANNAFLSGPHLADLLNDAAPELRQVVFIAHSAGSWAAHRAASKLLDYNPYVVINVVLLDPFIPGVDSSIATPLDTTLMGQLDEHSASARIFRIENYYAIDAGTDFDFDFGEGGGSRATSQTFDWRSRDINHRVDYTSMLLADTFYNDHGGPIRFYADTVVAAGGSSTPVGLAFAPWKFIEAGWFRSLSYGWFLLPKMQTHPQSQARAIGSAITLTVTATDSRPLFYQWYRNGEELPATAATYSFLLSPQNTGEYVVRVSNVNGMVFSEKATVAIASTLPSPSYLTAMPVSSGQINLGWIDSSPNEAGFKVERRIGNSDTWSQIAVRSANVVTYSDLGLLANTLYSYRVRAYNDAGDSAYSSVASAVTLASGGTTRTLTIASQNPSSGVSANSWVDTGSFASGATPTNRSFSHGTKVGVACPATLVGGQYFQKWTLDGADHAYETVTTVSMDSSHTITAVYGASPPVQRTLLSLTIEGPASVDERSSAQYQARATFSDGSTADAPATWSEDSGYAAISSAGLLNASAVEADRDVEIKAVYTYAGVTKTAYKDVSIRNVDAVATYSLTLSANNGYISKSPNQARYDAGTSVRITANAYPGYVFSHWSGDASGGNSKVYVTMNGNKSVTAHFTADTSIGSLQVLIEPPEVVAAGALWNTYPLLGWFETYEQLDNLEPKRYYINCSDVYGWTKPEEVVTDVVGGGVTYATATYQPIPGSVQVTIQPAAAAAAGAKWRLNAGVWRASGEVAGGVQAGNYTVEFLPVSGWTTPSSNVIYVQRASAVVVSGEYGPPVGVPLITDIAPKTGPITGGTHLTIDGANFFPGSVVTIAGVMASNIQYIGPTRIMATTPPSAVYGSAEIVVSTGTGSATNANSFAYVIPRGSNLALIASSGGRFAGVVAYSNRLYVGQGTTFKSFNIQSPANPVLLGSVTIPGRILDIALNGGHAVVATDDAGVHIVDITNPAAPKLRGFYSTVGQARAVEVAANLAYVVDQTNGLVILDVANPNAPARLSTLPLAPFNWDIALRSFGPTSLYAFVSSRNKIYSINVSNSLQPFIASELAISGADNFSIALAGNLAFLGRMKQGVDAVNISSPNNLANVGPLFTDQLSSPVSLASVSNRVVFGQWTASFRVADVSNTTVTLRGSLPNGQVPFSSGGEQRMSIFGSNVWVSASDSLYAVRISTPASPSRIWQFASEIGAYSRIVAKDNLIGAATEENTARLYGYRYTNNAVVQLSSRAHGEGQGAGIAVAQDVLAGFTASNVFRTSVQTNSLFQSLSSMVMSNMSAVDCYSIGNRMLSLCRLRSDGRAVISEHDLTRSDAGWITRQKQISIAESWAVGTAQIVGTSNYFILAYYDPAQSVFKVAHWMWNSNAPTWTVTSPPQAFTLMLAMELSHSNRYLHLGDYANYRIYDLQAAGTPLCVSTTPVPPVVSDILIDGDMAYLCAWTNGVFAYDISNKGNPVLAGFYDTPGSAQEIAKYGNRLFVADFSAGLQVLGVLDKAAPSVLILLPTNSGQFVTSSAPIALEGKASDDSGTITHVMWSSSAGGGGVAVGTTNWAINEIALAPGSNKITVSAFDDSANMGVTNIVVTLNEPDSTPPVVAITEPRPDPVFSVKARNVTLAGVVVDNGGINTLTWTNVYRDGGTATVSQAGWQVEGLELSEGPNVIQVKARDLSGNDAMAEAVIFFAPPDTNAPTIAIEFPTMNAVYESGFGRINLSGTAEDNVGVSRVEWSSSSGAQGVAIGTSPWNVNDIVLQPGLNMLDFTAYDNAENSATETLSVTYIPPPVNVSSMAMSDGFLHVEFQGPLGGPYLLEVSSNLVDWIPIETNVITTEYPVLFPNLDADNVNTRFYRISGESDAESE